MKSIFPSFLLSVSVLLAACVFPPSWWLVAYAVLVLVAVYNLNLKGV